LGLVNIIGFRTNTWSGQAITFGELVLKDGTLFFAAPSASLWVSAQDVRASWGHIGERCGSERAQCE